MSSNDLTQSIGKVPVLTGHSNYREWALDVKATARIGGLYKSLLGTDKAITTEPKDVGIAALETREEKAIGLITKTISAVLKVELDEYQVLQTTTSGTTTTTALGDPTANNLWAYLKNKFEKVDGVSAIIDFGSLTRARLVDDGTLEAQLNILQDLRSRCALNDFKYEDWQFAALLLLALPESYSHIKDSFLTTSTPKTLKPDDIRARILETENRRKAEADPAANILSLKPNAPAKGKGVNQRSGKRPPDNRPCHNCGKAGHWARECRAPKKDNASSSNANPTKPKQGKSGSSSLNVVEEVSDAESDSPFFAYFGAPENWLMDSGATDHMSPFGSDFKSYTAYAESRTSVLLGDGSTRLSVLGKGTIERWVEISPHAYRQIILQDVLHVEGIKRRFLSMGRLDDRGFTTTVSQSRLTISKGMLSFSGFRNGTLYTCIMYPDKPVDARSLNSVTALPIKTWHERMGHLNWQSIKSILSNDPPLIGIKLDASDPPHETCPGCAAGKAKRRAFKSSGSRDTRSSSPIERIHSDLIGPTDVSIGGHRFACIFTCDSTSHVWFYPLKSKDKTLENFKKFVVMIEKSTGMKIKFFHSDRGGEFMSDEFTAFLEDQGITRELSAPRTPQQNGVAERMNQTLLGGMRAMLHHSGMSKGFWAEAMGTAVHILNRAPRKGLGWRTPYELLFGRIPDVSYFRVFGCRAWVFNDSPTKTKLDPKSVPMIFVGYDISKRSFRLWNPETRSIVISANVRFSESEFPNRPITHPSAPIPIAPAPPIASSSKAVLPRQTVQIPLDFLNEDPLPTSKYTSIPAPVPVIPESAPSSTIVAPSTSVRPPSPVTPQSHPATSDDEPTTPVSESPRLPSVPSAPRKRQSVRKRKAVEKYTAGSSGLGSAESEGVTEKDIDEAYLNSVELFISAYSSGEPTSFQEAINSPERDKWIAAMKEEFDSLGKHGTMELVPRPEGRKTITCKWVYRIKYDANGNVVRHKARLVARGYSQIHGLDYTETFAPVTRLETLRLLFALAVEKDWEVRQIDVKTAYLYGDLDEEIYMESPEGSDNPPDHVYRLRKVLYGLRQAGRQWYRKLKETMTAFGLTQVVSDPHTFVAQKMVKGIMRTLVLPIYVDDLFPIGDKELTDDFEAWIGDYFDITPPVDVHYFLGIRVIRNRYPLKGAPYLAIDQENFVASILTRLIEPVKHYRSPLPSKEDLVENSEPKENANAETVRLYQSSIGSLMYIMLGTRPDLAYAVGKLARFSTNPSPDHLRALDRVFGYLEATRDTCLVYRRSTNKEGNRPYGYSDSDWAGDTSNSISTSGHVFFLSEAAFVWTSKKQDVVAMSTAEAEYIALSLAGQQATWIRLFLEQVGLPLSTPLEVKCDNQAAIAIASSSEGSHKRKKHIRIKYHSIQFLVERNEVSLIYVPSLDNVADQFTKSLSSHHSESQFLALGLDSVSNLLLPSSSPLTPGQ